MRSSGTGPGAKRISGVYQGSVEAVVAMLIAIGLGYWADERFDTEPWLLLRVAIRRLRRETLLEQIYRDIDRVP